MEDTLRYFFSAVFQGFAAIITLGIMFYLSYLDKFRKQLEDIESFFAGYKPTHGNINDFYVKEHGLVFYVKDKVLPHKGDHPDHENARHLVSKYEGRIEQKEKLNEELLSLFKIAALILSASLISLFCVGYFIWLNNILFFSGMFNILFSLIFFFKICFFYQRYYW